MTRFAVHARQRAQHWADTTLTPAARTNPRGDRFVAAGENIWPGVRPWVMRYLREQKLTPHRMFDHLLSSQACCLNFLAPFATRPAALAALLRPLVGEVTPVWLPDEPGLVAFEYISGPDYLNEGMKRTRGAQCTSVDAAIGFVRDGRRELLLIEWKYTESYGQPVPDRARPGATDGLATANDVRRQRYATAFARGVVAADLPFDAFLWEPYYQLLRQQLLADAIEADRDAIESAFDRVTLAHVSPRANEALKAVTSKAIAHHRSGQQVACADWGKLLTRPDRYLPVHLEDLFAVFPIADFPELAAWHAWMAARYLLAP